MKPAAFCLNALALALLLAPSAVSQWSTATLSGPRSQGIAVDVGSKVLVLSGGPGNAWPSNTVDFYDDQTGLWTSQNVGFHFGSAATSVGSQVLVAGGITHQGISAVFADVTAYDDTTGAWTSLSPLSQARGYVAATSVGSKALFAGGLADPFGGSYADVVDVYDAATGTWSTSSLSAPRSRIVAITVGSRALFAGGWGAGGGSSVVDVYDEVTGLWSTTALPTAAPNLTYDRLSGASSGSVAVFTNGFLVDLYDAGAGSWSSATLTVPRVGVAAASVGTKLLFAGGRHPITLVPSDVVEIYDVATGQWSMDRLSLPRDDMAAASVGSRALFCGGRGVNTGGPPGGAVSDVVDLYDDAIGASYCGPAAPNSTGLAGRITALGFPGSVAHGHSQLVASRLPAGTFGYFLCSTSQGLAQQPGGSQGDLCLGGAIGRYAATPFQSGADGRAAQVVDLAATPTPTGAVSVAPGETWNFQAWYRDANPGPTSNFTDATSVTFL